jgi:predicted HicB family RNase H-like nuclease
VKHRARNPAPTNHRKNKMNREFTFRITPEIYDQMAAVSKRELCSISTFIRQCVLKGLAERNEKHEERAA